MKKEVLFGSIAVSLALMAACGRKVENPGNSQTPPSVAPVPPKQLVCTKKREISGYLTDKPSRGSLY
jgi:hypothetical protein